jgi:NAD-dependent DNA ligase
MAIQYIGDKLKTDQDLFIKALKIEPKIKLFIPDELLENSGFLKQVQNIIPDLINPALKTTTVKQPKLESSTKKGGNKMKSDKQVLIFAATGKFEVFTRETLKAYIERKGHQLLDKISNKANYLINNDVNSTSSKNQFAKKNNIPIITEEELVKMLKK